MTQNRHHFATRSTCNCARCRPNAEVDDEELQELREAVERLTQEVAELKGEPTDAGESGDEGTQDNAATPDIVGNTGALAQLDERRNEDTSGGDSGARKRSARNRTDESDADTSYVAAAGNVFDSLAENDDE